MHESTFEYLKPTNEQANQMDWARAGVKTYADLIDQIVPPGPDKTYILRKLREVAMWVNVAITRREDGSQREDKNG